MKQVFSALQFDSEKFEFWTIYDSIKRFYPIGIPRIDTGLFHKYPGLKELETIIIDNYNDGNLNKCWKNLYTDIENISGKLLRTTSYYMDPSFSAFVTLDSFSVENFTRTKEIYFYISFLGPYYSVLGQDNSYIKIADGTFQSTNYFIVSPENEFADVFTLTCDKIEEYFKGYRFIPSSIYVQFIEGLQVSDFNISSTVFNALFKGNFDFDRHTLGNDLFKSEYWIKENYIDDGNRWTAYPPI